MKNTAANYRVAYLTANQVESYYRYFVVNRLIEEYPQMQTYTHAAFQQPEDYEVFINPEVVEGEGIEEI
jgi:peptide deformylase